MLLMVNLTYSFGEKDKTVSGNDKIQYKHTCFISILYSYANQEVQARVYRSK